MTSRPKIQIAVQGGGARLVALIAAMQALQELKDEVEVTRIAGTSAGAIAGVLFSAQVPMGRVRQVLTQQRAELVAEWHLASGFGTLFRVIRGKAIWSSQLLENLLTDLLVQEGKSRTGGKLDRNAPLEELPIPVIATSTDLDTLRAKVHKDGEGVLASVMHSTALPFLFRALRSNPRSPVDGGICDNLPASHLVGEEAKLGPTIGISFFPDAPTRGPDTVLEYALAIVNSAINHSVERTKQLLGPRCIQLVTSIETFAFEKALGDGLGRSFDETVEATKKELLRIVQQATVVPKLSSASSTALTDDDWKPTSDVETLSKRYKNTLDSIGEMYRRQHHRQKVRYVSSKLVVLANSLAASPMQPGRDQVISTSEITTSKDAVYCHRVALGDTGLPETVLDDGEISVFSGDGARVTTVVVPMHSTEEGWREVLLWFDPLLTPATGPYTVHCKSWFSDFLRPLRDTGTDELGIVLTRPEAPASVLEIVLSYPASFGQIKVTEASCDYQTIPQAQLVAVAGTAPKGYRTVGWRAREVLDQFRLKVAKSD